MGSLPPDFFGFEHCPLVGLAAKLFVGTAGRHKCYSLDLIRRHSCHRFHRLTVANTVGRVLIEPQAHMVAYFPLRLDG